MEIGDVIELMDRKKPPAGPPMGLYRQRSCWYYALRGALSKRWLHKGQAVECSSPVRYRVPAKGVRLKSMKNNCERISPFSVRLYEAELINFESAD
jgi:hypothetical protein